jgi:MFS family permease
MTSASRTSAADAHAAARCEHARQVRGAFWAVIAALMCVHAAMAATRVAGSLWLLQTGHPDWMVGTLMALFALAPLGLSMWAGRLADRHGMHRPLAVGVALGLIGPVLLVVHVDLVTLGLAALCAGGAVAVAAVAIQREAGQMAHSPDDLKRVFSWVALGPALSNSLSPVVVGLLIDHVGYRAAFVFAGLLPAAALLAGRRVPRQPPAPAGAPRVSETTAAALLSNTSLRRLLIVNLAMSSCWDAHTFAVPVLGHARHLSASAIGVVLGSFSVAATGVRLAISRFAPRLDERRALGGAMATAVAVSALYYFLPTQPFMMAGSFVLGLALGSVQPMILSMLHQVTPAAHRGQALGLRMLASNASSFVMPMGFGALAAVATAAPMWLMASLVALAMVPARRIEAPHETFERVA